MTMPTRGTFNTWRGRARFTPLADVVGWQEVNDDTAREKLAASLPGYHHHIPDVEWAAALPISWLADRHELVSAGQRKAHDGRARVSPARGVVWAVLKDLATGVTTAHINTHFVSRAWSKGVVSARPWRQEQWAQHLVVLNEVVQDFRAQGLPVVVGGDFNRHDPIRLPGMVNTSAAKRPAYDQILYSDPMPFVALTKGPRFGSDHHAWIAEFKGDVAVGNADYKRANADVQWFANAYEGSPIDPNVVVLHTTEGTTWPSYAGGASAPHYTAAPDWKTHRLVWRQHFPESVSSRALRNESGGVETNTLNCVQVELIGTCDPTTRNAWNARGYSFIYWPAAPEWALRDLADFIADQHKRNEIRLQVPKFLAYPESYGASSVRFSGAKWSNFYGICGHQHVPENTHGDPGALNIERVLRYALEKAYPDKPTRLEQQRDLIEGALTELDKAPAKRRRLHDMVTAIRDALTKGPKK